MNVLIHLPSESPCHEKENQKSSLSHFLTLTKLGGSTDASFIYCIRKMYGTLPEWAQWNPPMLEVALSLNLIKKVLS